MLAEIVLDNAAMRPGIPGPYLDDIKGSALVEEMIHLFRNNLEDFWQLAKMEQLPLA